MHLRLRRSSGPHVHIANGISIGSAVLAQLTVAANRHAYTPTDRTTCVTIGRIYATHAMRPNRRKAKSDCCPPGNPSNRLLVIVNCYLVGSPASTKSGNVFACTIHSNCPSCRMPAAGAALANAKRTTRCEFEVNFAHKIVCHDNVPWGVEKNNFRSFISGQNSTNRANFGTMGR